MKKVFAVIALAVTFAGLFWAFQASAYPLHNGDYLFWPEMPEAARVLADYKGTNDLDTAAHQRAALVLLKTLVQVAANGTGQNPWPPHERELADAYDKALPNGNGNHDELVAKALELQGDPSFVEPFLNRYFSKDAVRELEPLVPQFESAAQASLRYLKLDGKVKGVASNEGATGPALAYPPHQGEYLFWTQMPKAEQVVADTKGADDFDTAVRLTAELTLLRDLITVEMNGQGRSQVTVPEYDLDNGYLHALPKGNGDIAQISAKALHLAVDPTFVDPFLKRYFSDGAVREIEPLIPAFGSNALKNIGSLDARANGEEATAQQAARANDGAASLAKTVNQLTPEQKNQLWRILTGLCVIFVIFVCFWWNRFLRAFCPLQLTSDDPPRFMDKFSNYEVLSFTGVVGGFSTDRVKTVSGSVRTVGGNVEGNVTTKTTVINSIRLVDTVRGKEENFEVVDFNVQMWVDQVASVAQAERGNERKYLAVVNHTTNQVYWGRKELRHLYIQPSILSKIIITASLLFPPAWLIVIPWGIIVEVQVARFKKSGVKPLMESLNRKAEKFLQG